MVFETETFYKKILGRVREICLRWQVTISVYLLIIVGIAAGYPARMPLL